jgi:hypothetical protein
MTIVSKGPGSFVSDAMGSSGEEEGAPYRNHNDAYGPAVMRQREMAQ